jgi:hypothetical protein
MLYARLSSSYEAKEEKRKNSYEQQNLYIVDLT